MHINVQMDIYVWLRLKRREEVVTCRSRIAARDHIPHEGVLPIKRRNVPRPKQTSDETLMLQAARLFYQDDLTKAEIQQRLNVRDRRKVTSLLDEAKRTGRVRIYIDDARTESGLEEKVRDRFKHLETVIIVPGEPVTTAQQYTALLKRWAAIAAQYLETLIDHHEGKFVHVGISGGETLLELVNAFPSRQRSKVHVYATACVGRGRSDITSSHVDPVVNATLLWAKCGLLPGNCHYATVPPYSDLKERGARARGSIADELAELAGRAAIQVVIEGMEKLDIAFGGIGVINPPASDATHISRVSMTGLLKPVSVNIDVELARQKAVADFAYCVIDDTGRSKEDWNFFISAGHYSKHRGIAFYRNMVENGKKVITMAGPHKIRAIAACLKAKAFNIWITDADSAQQVLAMS
jgi:DNA-binding transcriptional regulator LsrR (DeoR family)